MSTPEKSSVSSAAPATWGAALNQYQTEKAAPPPPSERVVQVTRTQGMRSQREQREYNILTNTAPVPETEKAFRASADAAATRQRDRALQKEWQTSAHGYNIVTLRDLKGAPAADEEGAVKRRGGNQEPRGKRVEATGGTFASTAQYALQPALYTTPPPTPREVARREAHRERKAERTKRQFNIVNHEYLKNNAERVAADQRAEEERVRVAAMKAGAYNAITCTYRDLRDEQSATDAQLAKEAKARTETANHTYKISGIVGRSDGHAMDIITNRVYNPDCLLSIDKHAARGFPQRAELCLQWEHRRDVDDAVADAKAERQLRRIHVPQQRAEELARGYDILSTRPFASSSGAGALACDALKPPLPLQVLHPTSPANTLSASIHSAPGSRPVVASPLARTDGPRSSHERLFHHPSSAIAATASTFDARRAQLLPSLQPQGLPTHATTGTAVKGNSGSEGSERRLIAGKLSLRPPASGGAGGGGLLSSSTMF